MPWLRAARRACETIDNSHRVRHALLTGARANVQNHGLSHGDLVYGSRKVKKHQNTHKDSTRDTWYGPAIFVVRESNNVFVSYRGRVTRVFPERSSQAMVAEHMSWDIALAVKPLCVNALKDEVRVREEPLFDDEQRRELLRISPDPENMSCP